MENNLRDIRSMRNSHARIKIMNGHFVTSHSHINTYIDMSTVKCRTNNARAAAEELANDYLEIPIDTIVCLEGTELVGAFMAQKLMDAGMVSVNNGKNISILQPEVNQLGQMFFRDNIQRMLVNQNVAILIASVTTGKTLRRAVESMGYYGAHVMGISAIFSAVDAIEDIKIFKLFVGADLDVPYEAYTSGDCPMCKAQQKVDAIVNSFGYSKI